jgi:uncharacterized membrane protein YfcA
VTPLELAIATVIVAGGAAVQGGVGFGMNLIAAPLLALVNPELVPGPAIAAAVVLTVLVAFRERAAVDWRGVRFALAGRVPGVVVGALTVSWLSPRGVALAVGVAVLLAVALNVTRIRLRPSPTTLAVAGAVSGVAGTVSSIGGPPLAVVYANEPGPVLRGSLSVIFVLGGLMSLVALAVVGDFGRDEVSASLLLLIPGAVGFLVSRRLAAVVDAGGTRTAVLAVSVVGAVAVIVKELV